MTVSVLVSFHNHEGLVRRVAEAVLGQDYEDFEVVFVDDASTDGSWAVLQAVLGEWKNRARCRIKCLRNERNLGIVGTFNRLMEESSGEICITQCGDDLAHPDRVSKIVRHWTEASAAHPEIVAAVSRCNLVDEEFRLVRAYERAPEQEVWTVRTGEQVYDGHLSLHGAALAYSRKLWTKFGPLDPAGKFEDELMWYRIVLSGSMLIIRESLLDYRCAGGASTRYRTSIADTAKVAVKQERSYVQMQHDLERVRGILPAARVKRYAAELASDLRRQKLLVDLLTKRGTERRQAIRDWRQAAKDDRSLRRLGAFALPRPLPALLVWLRGTWCNLRRGTRLRRLVAVLERE